jgi:hypothetical protein
MAPLVRAEGPAEPLLRLVPTEAAVTVVVEDLSGHARVLWGSPLAEGLARLPAVKAWRAADGFRKFEQARGQLESALGARLVTIRDQILGEAVVLALRQGPDDPPEAARGLLLLRYRDQDLLDRVIGFINQSETQEGRQLDDVTRTHQGVTYHVRSFRAGVKPTEYYLVSPKDRVFAWSNAEDLIQGVIDRQAGSGGLGAEARFRKVRAALPPGAIASLFIDPRFLEQRIAAETRPKEPNEERLHDLLRRALAATDYAGAAVEWRDGLILHLHAALNPSRLADSGKRWAARPGGPAPLLRRVPPSALALAAGPIDSTALFDTLMRLVPEADRPRVENIQTALRGLFLGRDPRTEILPHVGPDALVFIDAPESPAAGHLPVVLVLGLGGDEGVSAAIDNALRTFLALYALDPKHDAGQLRVEARAEGAARLTTLANGDRVRLAYAVDRDLLVLGTTVEAVAATLMGAGRPGTGPGPRSRFERVRATYFPDAETFAFADLPALVAVAEARRDRLAQRLAARHGRPLADMRRDLDQALALLRLFQAAYATSAISGDAASIHYTIGLLARDKGAD